LSRGAKIIGEDKVWGDDMRLPQVLLITRPHTVRHRLEERTDSKKNYETIWRIAFLSHLLTRVIVYQFQLKTVVMPIYLRE